MYIPRQIESSLERFSGQFPAIALTGARQTGKSTLVKKVFPEYHYITFDDPVQRERAIDDPNLFLDSESDCLILDEIQYVPGLTSHLKLRIDQNRNKRGQYILTGSQQFNLIRNLSESLAGRIGLLELHPFSVSEVQTISHLRSKLSSPFDVFLNSCIRGMYPELNVYPELETELWYGSYLQTYLERDIRVIYDIGSLSDYGRFMQLLAARSAQVLNMSSIAKSIGIAVSTVKKWLSILEASNVIYLLQPYYNNFGKRITKSPKVYFLDNGLVCYLTGIKDPDHAMKGPMAGPLFESFCIQETIKTFVNSGKQPRIFYLRTNNGLEIDLLIEMESSTLHPIEIKLSKTPKQAMVSNIDRIRSVFDQLNIKPSRLLCLYERPFQLTPDTFVESIDSYLQWLEKTIA